MGIAGLMLSKGSFPFAHTSPNKPDLSQVFYYRAGLLDTHCPLLHAGEGSRSPFWGQPSKAWGEAKAQERLPHQCWQLGRRQEGY